MSNQNERAKWDTSRFFQTIAYFDVIPFFSCLQRLFAGRKSDNKHNTTRGKRMGIILVAGATGGVGKRAVQKLLENKYQVRALVRDTQRAKEMLGENVELFAGDMTIPETLTPTLMDNVSTIICCTGVKVQPIEGDTPEREKYYQGIKFYMPELVDSPEMVDYQGVKNLVTAFTNYLNSPLSKGVYSDKLVFDFTNPSVDLKDTWGAVDDVVMGGVSESSIRLLNNTALFTGNVSTANSGGFVSVRTRNFDPAINLSGYEGIELRVKGDGKRYKFLLRTESKWDGTGYSYSFDTAYNAWINVRIPFANLIPVFRAKTIPFAAPIDPAELCSFQLMLSKFEYDGGLNPSFEPGFFSLEIESIKAYGGRLPKFIMVSSAAVTRPGRPGINLEEQIPIVKLNEQLGRILTWKLRGEDSIRKRTIPYTIIRPCALTEEAGGKTLIFDQGDNISGKVSREDIAELCVQVLEQPKACNVTFEVKASENNGVNDWESLFYSLNPDR